MEYKQALMYTREAKLQFHDGDGMLPYWEYLRLVKNYENFCQLESNATWQRTKMTGAYKKPSYNISGCSEMVEDLRSGFEGLMATPNPTEANAGGETGGKEMEGLDIQMSQVLDQYQMTNASPVVR